MHLGVILAGGSATFYLFQFPYMLYGQTEAVAGWASAMAGVNAAAVMTPEAMLNGRGGGLKEGGLSVVPERVCLCWGSSAAQRGAAGAQS